MTRRPLSFEADWNDCFSCSRHDVVRQFEIAQSDFRSTKFESFSHAQLLMKLGVGLCHRGCGTELDPQKVKAARANVAQAGLAQFVDIREGDAMETLALLKETIDFLLLNGLKDIYLPMIKMLAPKMRAGSVVVTDNIFTFKTALAPYLRHMKNTENGFESVTLPIGYGMEYSIRLGG